VRGHGGRWFLIEFEYKAVNGEGEQVSGVIRSSDRRSAIGTLAEQGCFVTTIEAGVSAAAIAEHEEPAVKKSRGRVSSKDVLAITAQLSTALRAGLPLLHCLEIIGAQQKPGPKRQLI
jgi:type IV pilus assembly protein PilC